MAALNRRENEAASGVMKDGTPNLTDWVVHPGILTFSMNVAVLATTASRVHP